MKTFGRLARPRASVRQFGDATGTDMRLFFYWPFEHAEDLALQERCVQLFTNLGDANYLKHAIAHRDIIGRFGRFPHRNAILGRRSTAEELQFLADGGFAG